MRTIIILFFAFLFIQCSEDSAMALITKTESAELEVFQKFDSLNKLIIADDDESGEKLLLCLTFIDKASKAAIVNQRVSFYHTTTQGTYEPTTPEDETTARLNGTTQTDKAGRTYIKTILPGNYGSGENNRHIHTTVYGAKPEAYDLFLKQRSGGIGKLMNSNNDQMFYAELKKTTDSLLVCFATIEVKFPLVKN